MIRASGRQEVGGGLQALLGHRWRPAAAVVSEMAGRGRSKRRSQTGLARVGGDVGLAG